MVAFIYRCPTTGMNVQGWIADSGDSTESDEAYRILTCLACRQSHLVNSKTGKVVSAKND